MKYMGFRCHDMGYKTSGHGRPAHSSKHITMKRWPMHDCNHFGSREGRFCGPGCRKCANRAQWLHAARGYKGP